MTLASITFPLLLAGGVHSNIVTGPGVFIPHSPIHARTSSFGSNPQLYIPPPIVPGQAQQVQKHT